MFWVLASLFGIVGGYLYPHRVSVLFCITSLALAYVSARDYAARTSADLAKKIKEIRESNVALQEDLELARLRGESMRREHEALLKKFESLYRLLTREGRKEMEYLVERAMD
jgi:hypothetical protein